MKKHLLTLAVTALMAGTTFAQANDTIAKVKAAGSITMGVRDSSGALSYTLGDGKYVGYHVEICQRIIDNLEKAVGKKVEVKYTSVTSQNRIPLTENGTVDIECGSTTNNEARQKQVAFAFTTYVEEVRIAVRANSGISNIAQLNGRNVATTTGTTSVQLLRKNERATGVDFKEVFGKDHADSFLLLESGRADAFVMDGQILAGNIANSKADGEEPGSQEVVGVVGQLLFGQGAGVQGDLNDGHIGRVELDDVGRLHARRRDAQNRVALGGDLGDGGADVGALLEVDLENALAGDRQGFDAFDAVHRGGIGALADEDDAPLHIFGAQAVVAPGHINDRNINCGKDIDDHARNRDESGQHDQDGGYGHGVWAPQREPDEA